MEGDNDHLFRLSFSSEEPYERFFGPEILDHSEGAVNLDRLNSIGCVLFNHDRDEIAARINKAWIENSRGEAEIEFDPEDEETEKIWKKLAFGTLKGVSVGYIVHRYEQVDAESTSKDGRFAGPCFIATEWEPLEISVVSIPADPTVGVGRELEEESEEIQDQVSDKSVSSSMTARSLAEHQLLINKNFIE
jgi:phage head maturation protease